MIKAKISPLGKITFEEQCYIHASSQVLSPIDVGAYTYFGSDCMIGSLNIGRFCSVAPGVKIGLGEHEVKYVSTHPFFYNSKNGFSIPSGIGVPRDLKLKKHTSARIGNDVWIGANSIIARGVNIGSGAVVAAGSIVNKNVEPYSIVGGVPAKHIKYRFEQETINRLLSIEWWKFELSNFIGLDSTDPKVFLDSLELINEKKEANYQKFLMLSSGENIKI